MKLFDALNWADKELLCIGSKTARLDSEILLMFAMDVPREYLYSNLMDDLPPDSLRKFNELVEKRAAGKPIAYIVGFKEFWSMKLITNEDVLIPRPETELIVELVLDILKDYKIGEMVCFLDIGTGSGNISVAIAREVERCKICALDISCRAIKVAKMNLQNYGLSDRVFLACIDMLTGIKRGKGHFDFIVSNPPYIPSGDLLKLPVDVQEHEPTEALDGGIDGLFYYKTVICESSDLLIPGGYLILEIGYNQFYDVYKLIDDNKYYKKIGYKRDLSGFKRIIYAKRV